MSLLLQLQKLENGDLHLRGELPATDLDLAGVDELIHFEHPLRYNLEAQKMEQSILVQGHLEIKMTCECARCLKPFSHNIKLPGWACHLPLEGDEKVPIDNDCVDLTPFLREDILLELPQHPLCRPECGGLPKKRAGKGKSGGVGQAKETKSAWAELNKLKF